MEERDVWGKVVGEQSMARDRITVSYRDCINNLEKRLYLNLP